MRHRKKDVARLSRGITEYGLGRLTADAPNRLHTYAREMEIMEMLDSVFNMARRIARRQLKRSHQLPVEDLPGDAQYDSQEIPPQAPNGH